MVDSGGCSNEEPRKSTVSATLFESWVGFHIRGISDVRFALLSLARLTGKMAYKRGDRSCRNRFLVVAQITTQYGFVFLI